MGSGLFQRTVSAQMPLSSPAAVSSFIILVSQTPARLSKWGTLAACVVGLNA